MQTRSQKYSDKVFALVSGLVGERGDKDEVKRYKSLCKRAGSMLRTVGLIQFLTYLKAKSGASKNEHYRILLDHLRDSVNGLNLLQCGDSQRMLALVRGQNLPDYMRLTREVLQLLQWHKRIADILIEGIVPEGDD